MEVMPVNYMPGDPMLVDKIVCELKSQGIFDSFRKECIADVDTKPAYQNLRQRVEGSVSGFLRKQRWSPDMNKNHVREMLRKSIYESGFLETGVERIVDQVVNPKINTIFLSQVTDVVYKYLGIAKPVESNHNELNVTIDNLLPTDLEAISPDSGTMERNLEDSHSQDDDTKMDEDESPPFEPIEDRTVHEENSVDSHLSGFSGLLSHDSNQSDGQRPLQIDMDTQMSSSEAQSISLVEDQNSKTGVNENEVKMDCDDSLSKGSELESSDKSSGSTTKVDDKLKNEEKKDKDKKDRHRSSDRKDDKDKRSSDRKHSSSSSKDKKDSKSSSSTRSGDKHKSRHSSSSASRKESSTSSSHRDKSESKDRKSDAKSKSSSSKRDDKSSKSSSHNSKNKKSSSSSTSHKDKKDTSKKSSSSKDDHYSSKYRERRSTDRDSNDGSGLKSSSSSICESNSSSQNSTAQTNKPQDSNVTSNESGNSDAIESHVTLNLLNSGEVILGKTSEIKLYKPKIASNIHEARKLMKIRKQLKKLEQQSSLTLEALNNKNLVTNIIPKEQDLEQNNKNVTNDSEVVKNENEVLIEEEILEPPVLSVSMASWDALEAKLNQKVNFDQYNVVTTVESPPPSTHDNGDVFYFVKSEVDDMDYHRKLLGDAIDELAREIKMIESRIALSICNNVPSDNEVNKENKRVGMKRKSSDKSDSLKKIKNNNNSIEPDENCSLPLSPTGSDKSVANEGRTRRSNNVSKRYKSEDLYKPRPFITRTTSRCRAAQLD